MARSMKKTVSRKRVSGARKHRKTSRCVKKPMKDCKRASRCKWASGSKRSFCRRRRSAKKH